MKSFSKVIDDKYMGSVKVGPKGQIVIPKEARDMFEIQPGDTLLLLADKERGIAIPQKKDYDQLFKNLFSLEHGIPEEK
ncbi:AbrB/MazE/SpoVT family DNA-binding domain-containing protein [Caproicibacterium sp. NSD3]|jgi:AbrB family looped-hinge helix DNA binding protein